MYKLEYDCNSKHLFPILLMKLKNPIYPSIFSWCKGNKLDSYEMLSVFASNNFFDLLETDAYEMLIEVQNEKE